jgi:hypothetical protein
VWIQVQGFESYLVNEQGQVKSLLTDKILTPIKATGGYMKYALRKDGKTKQLLAHRVVAISFYGDKSDEGKNVNHKNGNKEDNSIVNLEWVTPKENSRHAVKMGLINFANRDYRGVKNPNFKLNDLLIEKIKKDFKSGFSRKELVSKYNLSYSTISRMKLNE